MGNKVLSKYKYTKLILETKIDKFIDHYKLMYGTDETIEFLESIINELKENRKPIIKGILFAGSNWLNKK